MLNKKSLLSIHKIIFKKYLFGKVFKIIFSIQSFNKLCCSRFYTASFRLCLRSMMTTYKPQKSLHIAVNKYFIDYLDRQICGSGRGGDIYVRTCMARTYFVMPLPRPYGRYLIALCLANSAALGSTKTKTQSY